MEPSQQDKELVRLDYATPCPEQSTFAKGLASFAIPLGVLAGVGCWWLVFRLQTIRSVDDDLEMMASFLLFLIAGLAAGGIIAFWLNRRCP